MHSVLALSLDYSEYHGLNLDLGNQEGKQKAQRNYLAGNSNSNSYLTYIGTEQKRPDSHKLSTEKKFFPISLDDGSLKLVFLESSLAGFQLGQIT